VSKHLYDSVRKATQADDASVSQLQQDLLGRGELTYDLRQRLQQLGSSEQPGKALELANQMLREGNSPAVAESVHRAGTEVDELRRGVEAAADNVLGDDTEQLKLARSELERLAEQLQQERQSMNDARGDASQRKAGADQQQKLADQNSPRSSNATTASDHAAGGERPPRDDASSRSTPRGRGTGARSLADASRPNATSPASAGEPGAEAGVAEGARERGPTSPNPQPSSRNSSGSENNPRGVATTDSSGRLNLETLLNGGAAEGGGGGDGAAYDDRRAPRGPLTGADFGRWTDGLRNVEQLLDSPDLRDAVANARERARLLRRDFTQSQQKPDWAVVELQVLRPLVEVRQRVAEELARHNARDSLAPIDHDPVPNRFAEAVRRYYEELGKDVPVPSPANPSRRETEPQ
jgi:hypothetical protein